METEIKNNNIAFFKQFIGQKMTKENTPSPVGAWLNGKVLDIEEGKVVVEFVVRQEWLNPIGTLHGGIIALIADELIGVATFSLGLDKPYVGVNLNVNFLKPSKLGDTVIASTEIIKRGRTIINTTCQLKNEKGDLIAVVNGNNMRIG